MGINFKGRHFFKEIILMAVRWYVAYSLSYRDIEELMSERGIQVDHATINRWVIKYSPQLLEAFKSKKKSVNKSWRMVAKIVLEPMLEPIFDTNSFGYRPKWSQ